MCPCFSSVSFRVTAIQLTFKVSYWTALIFLSKAIQLESVGKGAQIHPSLGAKNSWSTYWFLVTVPSPAQPQAFQAHGLCDGTRCSSRNSYLSQLACTSQSDMGLKIKWWFSPPFAFPFPLLVISEETWLILDTRASVDTGFAGVPLRGPELYLSTMSYRVQAIYSWYETKATKHASQWLCPSVKTAEASILLFQYAILFTASVTLFEISTTVCFIYFFVYYMKVPQA